MYLTADVILAFNYKIQRMFYDVNNRSLMFKRDFELSLVAHALWYFLVSLATILHAVVVWAAICKSIELNPTECIHKHPKVL